jgi:hypothetical protein
MHVGAALRQHAEPEWAHARCFMPVRVRRHRQWHLTLARLHVPGAAELEMKRGLRSGQVRSGQQWHSAVPAAGGGPFKLRVP